MDNMKKGTIIDMWLVELRREPEKLGKIGSVRSAARVYWGIR